MQISGSILARPADYINPVALACADPVADLYALAHKQLFNDNGLVATYALAILQARYRYRVSNQLGKFFLDERLKNSRPLRQAIRRWLYNASEDSDLDLPASVGETSDVVDILHPEMNLGLIGSLAFEETYLRDNCVPLRVPYLDSYYATLSPDRKPRVVRGSHVDSLIIQSLVYKPPVDNNMRPSDMPLMTIDSTWPLGLLEQLRDAWIPPPLPQVAATPDLAFDPVVTVRDLLDTVDLTEFLDGLDP